MTIGNRTTKDLSVKMMYIILLNSVKSYGLRQLVLSSTSSDLGVWSLSVTAVDAPGCKIWH